MRALLAPFAEPAARESRRGPIGSCGSAAARGAPTRDCRPRRVPGVSVRANGLEAPREHHGLLVLRPQLGCARHRGGSRRRMRHRPSAVSRPRRSAHTPAPLPSKCSMASATHPPNVLPQRHATEIIAPAPRCRTSRLPLRIPQVDAYTIGHERVGQSLPRRRPPALRAHRCPAIKGSRQRPSRVDPP